MSKLLQAFPTPIWTENYKHSFKKEFNFIKKLSYNDKLSSQIHTPFNVISVDSRLLKCKALAKLKTFIQKGLDIYANDIIKVKSKLVITQSWANKNITGTLHAEHTHYNSLVSGVFYFQDSLIGFSKLRSDTFKLEEITHSLNAQSLTLQTKAGDLILFPSSLAHSVPSNWNIEARYSISFNTFTSQLGSAKNLTELKVDLSSYT